MRKEGEEILVGVIREGKKEMDERLKRCIQNLEETRERVKTFGSFLPEEEEKDDWII